TTSGSIVRSASAVRRAVPFPVAIGAIDPFDSHSIVGPTETIDGSGGGPSHGATMRTSTSILRNSRASPSTWPCTPPGRDIEYGHTIAIFMRLRPSALDLRAESLQHPGLRSAPGSSCFAVYSSRFAVAGPVRLEQMPLLGRGADQ